MIMVVLRLNGCVSSLIIPDSIHTKSWLFDIASRDSSQPLAIPSIHLNKALFIICQSQPLITPITWSNRITMPTARTCRRKAHLPFYRSFRRKFECGYVSRDSCFVGARCGEEGVTRRCDRAHVCAVHFGVLFQQD